VTDSGGGSLATTEPLVSVIIPTYNRAASLAAALDSVLAQSYPKIEIVVVDDGSTDDTGAVVARYGDRIRFQLKPNGGVATARNVGLAAATGELLAFLDSDDVCLPQRIATQVACFRQFPEIVLCSSDFSAVVDGRVSEASHIGSYYSLVGATPGGVRALYSHHEPLQEAARGVEEAEPRTPITVWTGRVYEQLVWGNFIHPPTVMVRRSVVEQIGGFDETIPVATEYDWLIRVSRAGLVAYLDHPFLLYGYSGAQLSGPKHHARISLDTVATLQKVRLADPALYRRHKSRFRRRIGESYLRAGDATAEQDRPAAMRMWFSSVACGALGVGSLKVLAKILMPSSWLHRLRLLRGTAVSGSGPGSEG
jgi:glycosyltransferase involved in cell wall biosynthesis